VSWPQSFIRYPLHQLSGEKLIFVPMPTLVSLLQRAEQDKGAPLTEPEVMAIRDGCTCVALPQAVAAGVARDRGYDDIDPERCWEQWQLARKELLDLQPGDNQPQQRIVAASKLPWFRKWFGRGRGR
jgi:hypothetical protein